MSRKKNHSQPPEKEPFWGNIFDVDGDGKTSLQEYLLWLKMGEEAMKDWDKRYDPDLDFDLDTDLEFDTDPDADRDDFFSDDDDPGPIYSAKKPPRKEPLDESLRIPEDIRKRMKDKPDETSPAALAIVCTLIMVVLIMGLHACGG